MADETRILFIHIPKTAGISLYRALEQWAGADRSLRFPYGGLEDVARYRQLPDAELGRLRLLSGHLGFQAFKTRDIQGWSPITVLRDPVERLLSLYTYAQGTPGHPWYSRVRDMTVEDFLEWLAPEPYHWDSQCRAIAGRRDAAAAIEILATEFLLACSIEDVDALVRQLSAHLGYELVLERANVSPGRTLQETISDAALATIRDMTVQDDDLLRYVRGAGLVGLGATGAPASL